MVVRSVVIARGESGIGLVAKNACKIHLRFQNREDGFHIGFREKHREIVGVAVVEALEDMGVEGVKLKWPNDLYHNDKKLAGILVELSGQSGGAAHIVIGLGLNLSMDPATSGIGQPWTSLKEVCDGKVPDRNDLAQALINAWDKSLVDYELKGMSNFVERWNRLDNFLGRNVRLIIGPREIEGVVQGIDEQGAVLLKTENGVESYIGGEISLRKGD